ncbi:MAG: AMP-dependent synthetase, partial [Chloroflexota bacterium]
MDRRGLADFDELMRWSTEDVGRFWEAVLADLDIRFDRPYERILDTSRGIAWAQWCVGGKLNIVTNCLDKWLGTPTQNRAAVCWEGEEGQTHTLTYLDLYYEVNRMANALRSLGLKKGDAIGLYMPMIPEIVIALLAIVKIGGIVLPLFSGYAAPAIATRLIDAEAQVLFTADGVYRRGQVVPMKDIADEAVAQSPS